MCPIPENILIALEHAALSNFVAMYHLGFMYGNGVAVSKNINKAIHFLQKAINIDDDPNLLFYLADCYSRRKTKKDLHKAFELFGRAADQGYGKAMVELGLCYEKGKGVDKDWNKAIDQYRRAVEVGKEEVNKDIQKVLLLQNFIGKNNPKAHKVKGWLEDKLPHSTVVPAFDPPIMAGDWKQLTAEEVKICLDKVLTPFKILGLVDALNGYFGQYARSMPLSFYKDCSLVDIQIYNQLDKDTLIFSAIFNAENAILLHYDFDLIKSLNPYLLSFSDEKSVIDYLTFCTLYDEEVGGRNYQLISSLKELPCEKEEIQRIQERTKHNFFRPQHISGSFEIEGYQQFKVVFFFDNALSGGVFDVFPDGNYFNREWCDCIIDDVTILQRQYGSVFRTPLPSVKD